MPLLLTVPAPSARFLRKHLNDYPSVTAVYSDPEGIKLGSGGGTVNVLWKHGRTPGTIIVHSDGESRRLPAYAATGKSLMPFPVFRWGRGQRIDQSLLDLQRPLLERILDLAPASQRTLVASGDVLVWLDSFSGPVPVADIVCLGAWAHAETATRHGVFIVSRQDPGELIEMLQKPSMGELEARSGDGLFLLDTGIWIFSDRAVDRLYSMCGWDARTHSFRDGQPTPFDLYSGLGALLAKSRGDDPGLTVRVLPLEKAEFYHFGTNADLLKSTRALQDRVTDQRDILHRKIKPSADIFVQNSEAPLTFSPGNQTIWIENACLAPGWKLRERHILTGVPANEWSLDLPAGTCLDLVPSGRDQWCIRPYGFYDTFRGAPTDPDTKWMERPVAEWFEKRGIPFESLKAGFPGDLYDCPLFPVVPARELTEDLVRWMISGPDGTLSRDFSSFWLKSKKIPARQIVNGINLSRLLAQRKENLLQSIPRMAANHARSVFFQLDLAHMAAICRSNHLSIPGTPPRGEDVLNRVHDLMFRSACRAGSLREAKELEAKAFTALRETMTRPVEWPGVRPVLKIHRDQILWARSPVRLDLAGGWTDTPPYCLVHGGKVTNMAVELNGQPPIQVYIRAIPEPEIRVRSVDQGVTETVRTFAQLGSLDRVGSPFAIPKASLMLAGFHPKFSGTGHSSLRDHLREFGGGLDISLMVAVPKGSGLGTSSILAATLLGGLSEICSLGWSRHDTGYRTLILEQLLTTGGGWQDQFGGIFEGVKLIESQPGLNQYPGICWAPDYLFDRPGPGDLVLLYYTGINRVAKSILADIVRGMFLNSGKHLGILGEMKHHALHTYESIRKQDWNSLVQAVRYSWELNNRLDPGTNPPQVDDIIRRISDYAGGYKLLGAGGGGYLLIFAKDAGAVQRIRKTLAENPPNPGARFVNWGLSAKGLEITKS